MELLTMTEINIKEISAAELKTELIKGRQRIVNLRNQLLNEAKKSVEYNEEKGIIRMKKQHYDILFNDYQNTTER